MKIAIRAPRAHFFRLFGWKSDLGLSWRHLRGILGRLGKSFGPSWAPKTPPRCATWAPRPPRTSKTSKMTPKSRFGTPRGLVFGAYMGAFGIGFWPIFYWFLVRSGPPFHRYFDWIFPRVFQEQSWDEGFFLENRGRDPRAFFFARTPSILEIFEWQVTSQARWRARRLAALWIYIYIYILPINLLDQSHLILTFQV